MDSKATLEQMMMNSFQLMVSKMSEEEKERMLQRYGSMENFYLNYKQTLTANQSQPGASSKAGAAGGVRQLNEIIADIAEKRDFNAGHFRIKKLIKEYEAATKLLYKKDDVSKSLLEMAALYRNNAQVRALQDAKYGDGTSEFLARAIEAYYQS